MAITQAQLTSEIASLWPDNTVGQITPAAARQTLNDMVTATFGETIALTGDVTGSGIDSGGIGTNSFAATLATVNSNIGTFQGLTVNGKGLVTAASNQSYLTGNQTITLSSDVTGSGTTAITATIANNAVTNAKAAQMAAKTFKANATAGTANATDITGDTAESLLLFTQSGSGATQRTLDSKIKDYAVSVIDFGADPTGVADSATAINNAIASLPVNGGTVFFPVGTYKIGSTITIGNGTSSAVSTRYGVLLIGSGIPNAANGVQFFNGFPSAVGPRLVWAGGTNSFIINIAGPLKGWGVQNLYLDGSSTAGMTGIGVSSGGEGDNSNLTIVNCPGACISSSSQPIGGYTGVGNVDSIRNNWTNIDVLVPAVANAKGILLNGDAGGTSDTDYNTWTNVFIRFVGSPGAGTNYGLYLGVSDSNVFNSLNISGGTTSATVNVQYDYSINSVFPSANAIFGLDANGSVTQFAVTGSPSSSARPNSVFGILEANAATYPTGIANLNLSLPLKAAPDVSHTGQVAAIVGVGIFTPYVTGMYRVNWYMNTTQVGTGGNYSLNIGWNDGGAEAITVATITATTAVGTAGALAQGSTVMHAVAATAISYSVSFSGVTGSLIYNVFLTVERLN